MTTRKRSVKPHRKAAVKHLARRHWHHVLSVVGLVLSGVVLGAGGTAVAAHHFLGIGGYKPGPLPRQISVGGGPLPASWSLVRYETRVHDQGSYWSCVGQTISLMEEITQKERGRSYFISAGYIWNQLNGGNPYAGITYQDAFRILARQGDPRLRDFGPDGSSDATVQPDARARAAARPFRYASWASISPDDRHTVEAEIHAGRPVALAMPFYESTYAHFGDTTIPRIWAHYGRFLFWHSLTIVGYSPWGVLVQNSAGTGWGQNGRAWFSWGFLSSLTDPDGIGAGMVVASPRGSSVKGTVNPRPGRTQVAPTPVPTRKPRPKLRPTVTATPAPAATIAPGSCTVRGAFPDPSCTPGATLNVTAKEICVPGYSRSVRNVPPAEKQGVYRAYGILQHTRGQYEVDHLISLELGGSNEATNLWPEAAEPRPGFHEKDLVENYLHDRVCSGAIPLSAAQQEIRSDWLAVYREITQGVPGAGPNP